MKINIEYPKKLRTDKDGLEISNQEITSNIITYAITNEYGKGMEGQLRRIWGRIQRKLEDAIEQKAESVDLEQAEKDLIVKTFEKCPFPAIWSLGVNMLEEEIENIKKEPAKAK